MRLTGRDRKIIRLVYQHRFLRSNQIAVLQDCPSPQLLRRLQLLYHHGYLERPRAQLDYYHQGGSRPIVYGLGNKGGNLLRQELGDSFRPISWGEKNRAVGRIFLEHALLVSEVMVALELACRVIPSVRLLWGDDLLEGKQFKWKAKLNSQVQLGLIPDRTFVLEFQDAEGRQQRVLYFLEADRGTMPVIRKSLAQTSLYRKLLAYEATWSQDLHRTEFGFNRMRVLFVTKSAARVKSMVDVCGKLSGGHGLFLFADKFILQLPESILSANWQMGRPDETSTLLS
jgi:hypothetical protein